MTAARTRTPRKTAATDSAVAVLEPAAKTPVAVATVAPVTGYDTETRLYSTRYKQGGRTVYALDLSLSEIQALITKPDPNIQMPGNRAVRPAHAASFAKYLREHDSWVVPAMIFRTPNTFQFETMAEVNGTEFGVVSFPRQSATDIHILDGMHRTLGIHIAANGIVQDLDKARSTLASARRQDPKGAAVNAAQKHVDSLTKQRDRMGTERISVQIFVEDDMKAYRQMFFDIADNALGITSSVKARFDTSKVVNRALEQVLLHPLLANRIDPEKDYVGPKSEYLLGAKHVAEIIRSAQVGLEGRVSRRQDKELKEQDVARNTIKFLDVATAAFPQFQAIEHGQLMPAVLRKTSLLGSVLMLKILAGVYQELKESHAFSDEMVGEYFAKLAPHMTGPAYAESVWMTQLDRPVFTEGAMGPMARRQEQRALKDAMVAWAIDKPNFLDQPPAPRPEPALEPVDPEYGAGYTAVGADVPLEGV